MNLPRKPMAAALTYTLGRSLYIPLTSRCNSLTLPETRGPNFLLPSEVVSCLLVVRDLEFNPGQHDACFDVNAERQRLPPPLPQSKTKSQFLDSQLQENISRPTVEELIKAIDQRLSIDSFDALVIAGEGEPTLRLSALLKLSQWASQRLPVRVTTNGLASPGCAKQLKDAGVDAVSVALMTAHSQQYNQLMGPLIKDKQNAHEMVCEFVQATIKAGLNVEVTGVDHDDVNKMDAERLAKSLGVISPFRWRPYFP